MLKVVHSSRRLLVILVVLVSAPILMSLANNSASAADLTPSVTVNSSLTVTIPSTPINLNLNPYSNNFGYGDVTITVGTNNPAGYKTIMTSVDGTTNLTDSEDAEKVIPTLTTSGLTENTFEVNHWGYKKDSGNYQPFTTDTVILESDTYANDDTTTLRFATKIDYMQPDGDYSTVLSFTTTATPNVPTIQNLDPTLCTTDPTLALDTRDNQMYTVQRLADGNCWMMDNLNLGATNTLAVAQLDSTNTNFTGSNASNTIDASTFLGSTWKKSSGSGTYTDPEYIPITDSNSATGSDTDPTSNTKYGTLYNYCAASAQTICTDSNSVDASSDLCPAGWRLPNTSGEFQTLYNQSAYNSNANMRKSYENGGAAFALAGYFYISTPTGQGSGGGYWSSTRSDSTNMYRLNLSTSNVDPAYGSLRYRGASIRCVLNDTRTLSDITYLQDMTSGIVSRTSAGTTKTLKDKRDNEEYLVGKLADGNIWLLDNLRLDPTTVSLDKLKGNTNATDEILTYFKNGGGSSPYPSSGVSSAWTSSAQDSHDLPYVATAYKDTINSDSSKNYGNGSHKYGVYYNYCAASAGSYCYASNAGSGNAQYDICPSGWKMPTGDTAKGSYYYLLNTGYSGNKTATNTGSLQYNLSTPLSGLFYSGLADGNQGNGGWFWSSTRYNDSAMHYLSVFESNANPQNSNHRYVGVSVRCIAK